MVTTAPMDETRPSMTPAVPSARFMGSGSWRGRRRDGAALVGLLEPLTVLGDVVGVVLDQHAVAVEVSGVRVPVALEHDGLAVLEQLRWIALVHDGALGPVEADLERHGAAVALD